MLFKMVDKSNQIKPTAKQSGGILGTLLVSIGVPILLNALKGKGLQVDPSGLQQSRNVYIPKKGKGEHVQFQPPPFYGTWDIEVYGRGKKKTKKKVKDYCWGKQSIQWNTPVGDTFVKQRTQVLCTSPVKFVKKTLSNYDLL